jgi:hypothetical protein
VGTDSERRERIQQVLVAAIHEFAQKPTVTQRWLAYAAQLSEELAPRADLSESLVKRRARDFFRVSEWSRLGDPQQAEQLRVYLVRKT